MFIEWPAEKPKVKENLIGWLRDENKIELDQLCADLTEDDIILELGSYYGLSAKFFMEHSKAKLICVDHFQGSTLMDVNTFPAMFNTFMVNLWEYRNRIRIFKNITNAAWSKIKNENIKLIYIDASHEILDAYYDITNAFKYFPTAKICGDDFKFETVKYAIDMFISENLDKIDHFEAIGNFWELING